MKTKHILAAAMFIAASAGNAAGENRWVTREASIACTSYFAIGDAWKAYEANDRKWLSEIGCILVGGEVPATPIDTKSDTAWRVRLHAPGGDATVYIPKQFIVSFAKSVGYKTEKEAQAAATEMLQRYNKRGYIGGQHIHMPHKVISSSDGRWEIRFGPQSFFI
jgi:hypothetical protein